MIGSLNLLKLPNRIPYVGVFSNVLECYFQHLLRCLWQLRSNKEPREELYHAAMQLRASGRRASSKAPGLWLGVFLLGRWD